MMSEYRSKALARLDGMSESGIGGGCLELVTVCLSGGRAGGLVDEHGSPAPPPAQPVVSYLRPSEVRALAFCLLELAELAERRSELP
jgi:hypothetical protein